MLFAKDGRYDDEEKCSYRQKSPTLCFTPNTHNCGTVAVYFYFFFLRVFKVQEYIRVAFAVLVCGGAAAVADVRVHV